MDSSLNNQHHQRHSTNTNTNTDTNTNTNTNTSPSTNRRWGKSKEDASSVTLPAIATPTTNSRIPTTPSSSKWIQMIRNDSSSKHKKRIQIKRNYGKSNNFDNDDDDDDQYPPFTHSNTSTSACASASASSCASASWGHLLHLSVRLMMGATVTLYLLNQKHLLPKPLSSIVSRTLFWPTLPITVSRRIGKWVSDVDTTVVMGGAPFGFCRIPDTLYNLYGVRGVVNMCEEYNGPTTRYAKLGIEELHLKTVDHFEPSLDDLKSAVSFIRKLEKEKKRVYVHCRAGHGRSAAIVLAWLLYKNPQSDPMTLNQYLCEKRNVRKTLWKQPNINAFYSFLQETNS